MTGGNPYPNATLTPSNPATPLNNAHNNSISLQNLSNSYILSAYDKQRNASTRYGTSVDNDLLKVHQQQFRDMKIDSSPVAERNGMPQKELSFLSTLNDTNGECTLVQMEKDNLELRRELQDALANNKQAGKKIQKWVVSAICSEFLCGRKILRLTRLISRKTETQLIRILFVVTF